MPTPSFTYYNGQVKTALRWYDSREKKNDYKAECYEAMRDCRYKLLAPNNRMLQFQLATPFGLTRPTAWGIYDLDDNLVKDLASHIGFLTIDQFNGFDYITYTGDGFDFILDEGFYYSIITRGGHDYYSEDFYVPCGALGENILPELTDGPYSIAQNPDSPWLIDGARVASGYVNISGNPSDGDLQVDGYKVINLADNKIYTRSGGTWSNSIPLTGVWFETRGGTWWRFVAGAWTGLVSDPFSIDDAGACQLSGFDIPFKIQFNGLSEDCHNKIGQVRFTITGMTQGSVTFSLPDGSTLTATEDGDYHFNGLVEEQDFLAVAFSGSFDGCISAITYHCQKPLDRCHMRLSWSNCGVVGNTYYGSGLEQEYYVPTDSLQPRAETKLTIETEQQDNGEVIETNRTEEITYSAFLGVVPWYVADALVQACLHDTVKLSIPGSGDASDREDTLLHPRITFDRKDAFSKCMVAATITYQMDNVSVACCDDFEAPCRITCVNAFGYNDNEDPVTGGSYLDYDTARFQIFDGFGFGSYLNCANGLVNMMQEEDNTKLLESLYFNVNTTSWVSVAENTQATAEAVDADCYLTARFNVIQHYSGILQYLNDADEWVDITTQDFTWSEWVNNDTAWEGAADQNATKTVRLKVYSGDCVIGYSQEVTYTCA